MLSIDRIPAFTDNYIWAIRNQQTNKVAIVDPGDAKPVIQYLEETNALLSDILITHHHRDHTGGISELKAYSECSVWGPANESIPMCDHQITEGDSVTLSALDCQFEILDLPGHTLGHIAYFTDDMLFCGDTLFAGGCGRLFEGSPAQMLNSLTKLSQLPAHTRVYCAHEYTQANLAFAATVEPNNRTLQQRVKQVAEQRDKGISTVPSELSVELATNPFLRTNASEIKASVETFSKRPLSTQEEVFAELRSWKDQF